MNDTPSLPDPDVTDTTGYEVSDSSLDDVFAYAAMISMRAHAKFLADQEDE